MVGGGERGCDLQRDAGDLVSRHRPARDPRRQRLALDQLEHEVIGVVLATDVVQRADVRVVEARDRFRLALEAGAECGIGGEGLGQHLDRDLAAEPGIAGAPHFTHAAGPKGSDDFVGAEAGSGGEGHGWGE